MKKNFFFYLMPSLVKGIFGICVIVPITTYYLDPKDFGIAAIIIVIAGLMTPLSSIGYSWVLSANYFKINEEEKKELTFNILVIDSVLKLPWFILFWLVGKTVLPLLIKNYEHIFFFYFQLALIAIMLNGLWAPISNVIILQKKGKIHALLEMIQWGIGALTIIVCLVMLKLTTITLFIMPIVSGLTILGTGLWYIRKHVRLKISRKWIMEILKVGMPAIPMNFSETISISVDRYFIQKWLNLSHLGIYSHSMSYKQSFSMGTKAFTKIYFPEVVQIVSNKGDPEKLKRIMTVWYGLLGIAGLFVTLFSYEIIDIITHGKFVKAAPLVPLWFLLTFSYSFGRTYSSYLAVLKKTMFMMYTSIGVGAIFTAIAAFLIYQFGIMGAVVAAILSNFTLQLTRRIYSVRLGCAPVAEKEFMLAAGIILSVFFINSAIPFNFAFKSFCFIVCSILIAYRFNLIQLVKTHFMDNLQWLKSAS